MAMTPATSLRPVLELDGSAALLQGFAGLGFDADIVTSSLVPQPVPKKSVAAVRFTPGQARVGLGMGRGLYGWCTQTSAGAGLTRDPQAALTVASVPNLRLHISAADYLPWLDAATHWFVGGEHLEANEMRGRISLLDPSLSQELASIDLFNVGFKSFAHEEGMQAADGVPRFVVELYVEAMALNIAAYGA